MRLAVRQAIDRLRCAPLTRLRLLGLMDPALPIALLARCSRSVGGSRLLVLREARDELCGLKSLL